MEYGDFENSKEKLKRLSGIIRELYSEGYTLLYNLSLRPNKKWKKIQIYTIKRLYLMYLST